MRSMANKESIENSSVFARFVRLLYNAMAEVDMLVAASAKHVQSATIGRGQGDALRSYRLDGSLINLRHNPAAGE